MKCFINFQSSSAEPVFGACCDSAGPTRSYIKFIFEGSDSFYPVLNVSPCWHCMNKPSYILFLVIILKSLVFGKLSRLQEEFFTTPWNSFKTHRTIQKMLLNEKIILLFWIVPVLAVCVLVYVFMCDVLWSRNTAGVWFRRALRFPQTFTRQVCFRVRDGVYGSRSKLWLNNFINVNKMCRNEAVFSKQLTRPINNLNHFFHFWRQEDNFTACLEVCRSDAPRLQ